MTNLLNSQIQSGRTILSYQYKRLQDVDDVILELLNEADVEGFIKGNLNHQTSSVDYDVTDLIPLSKVENICISDSVLQAILKNLYRLLAYLEDSFIDEEYVIFDSECVFFDSDYKNIYLIVLPCQKDGASEMTLEDCVRTIIARFENNAEHSPFVERVIGLLDKGIHSLTDLQHIGLVNSDDVYVSENAEDKADEQSIFDEKEFHVPEEGYQEDEDANEEAQETEMEADYEVSSGFDFGDLEKIFEDSEDEGEDDMKAWSILDDKIDQTVPNMDPWSVEGDDSETDEIPDLDPWSIDEEEKTVTAERDANSSADEKHDAKQTEDGDDVMHQLMQEEMREDIEDKLRRELEVKIKAEFKEELLREVEAELREKLQAEIEQKVRQDLQAEFEEDIAAFDDDETLIPVPHLVRKKTGEIIQIDRDTFIIGKLKDCCDYAIVDNNSISRIHAIIKYRESKNDYCILDCNSTNHTYLNGRQIPSEQPQVLTDGMRIHIALEEFSFEF